MGERSPKDLPKPLREHQFSPFKKHIKKVGQKAPKKCPKNMKNTSQTEPKHMKKTHQKKGTNCSSFLRLFGFILDPLDPPSGENIWRKLHFFGDLVKMLHKVTKMVPKGTKMVPKWSPNGTHMEPKWYPNVAKLVPNKQLCRICCTCCIGCNKCEFVLTALSL